MRDLTLMSKQTIGYLQSIFYNRFLIMSWINFFGLIEGLDIVKFSEYLDKNVE